MDWLDYSRPLDHRWFYMRYWRTALRDAGLPEYLRFYDLRHAHASMIAASIGTPGALTLKECQERMGHSNMATFYDRYVKSPKDEGDRVVDALDAMWRTDDTAPLLTLGGRRA
jgi:integrase